MFKKNTKILSTALILILLSTLMTHPIYAATNYGEPLIEPQWKNTTGLNITLNVNNPQINLSIIATSYAGTTYNNGVAVLEKISGSNCGTVKTWTGISSNTSILSFSDNTVTRTSGTYRLTFTVTTVRNGVSETISASKEATY